MALSLDVATLRVTICFLGAISAVEEIFYEKFFIFEREI